MGVVSTFCQDGCWDLSTTMQSRYKGGMSIESDLRAQLTAAMKAKDLKKANVIRMINTKVMEKRTSKGFSGEVDDALYREVIAAYKKSLDKAMAEYQGLGERGAEQVAELRFESEFCAQFLPAQMTEEEARVAVAKAVAESGADNVKMAGRVVGLVMKTHKGRVDAGLVKRLVDQALASS